MSASTTEDVLTQQGVVAIVRTSTTEGASRATGALLQAGVRAIEVSFTTPGATTVIAEARATAGPAVVVGAGTVRTPADAAAAYAAGAQFLVSPVLDVEVVGYAVEHDLAVLPGVLTPTEIEGALRAGARMVKIFPAHLWSPAAMAAVAEAMPDVRFVPTGGIDARNAPAWIAAGAAAVGVGGSLVRAADPAAALRELVDAIAAARG